MIKYLFLLFIVFNSANMIAQELPEYLRAETKYVNTNTREYDSHYHKLNKIQDYGDVEKRNYDVLNYSLYFDLRQALNSTIEDELEIKNYYFAQNRIRLVLTMDADTLELDAENLEINYIEVNNVFVESKPQPVNGLLKIPISNYIIGDTLELLISYKSIADKFADFRQNRGMHIYHKGYSNGDKDNKGNIVQVEHNIVYTMSEPELARYWMPCNDRPYDKATSEMVILVPDGYKAISNGLLMDTEEQTGSMEGNILYVWKNEEPITTYLMNFAASVYEEYKQTVVVDKDTIDMLHYAWPEDISGDYFKLIPSMDTHPQMMKTLIENFGAYPFSRYGTVTVYPFAYGGMEHPTNVTQNRFWLRDNGDDGFVHEMGHHWFGDMMTCATWADIWINEGGASFTEAVYFGDNFGEDKYRKTIESKTSGYFRFNESNKGNKMYAVPTSTFFAGEGYLIYDKGAVVLNLMKENLGDEQFFRVIKEILQDYKYQSITTDQYRQAWKEKAVDPIVDINLFFDQWVYSPGHPEYVMETGVTKLENDKYRMKVTVNQIQENNTTANKNVPNLFVTTLRFQYRKGKEIGYSDLYLNDSKEQTFYFEADFLPSEVTIDPLSVLHLLRSSELTSVELEDYVGGIELFPNPATGEYSQLNMNIEKNVTNAKIELIDILGNKIKELHSGNLRSGGIGFKIMTNTLPSGIYIININLDGVNTSKKLIVQ